VRPRFSFGDTRDFHWAFSPKLYAYVEKSENPDIAQYRGYGDFRLELREARRRPVDGANRRKGTQSSAFSAEPQGSYPLNRLSAGLSDHLMAQYFTGYGENLLRYNEREPWTVRLGYAVSR